MKKTITFLAAAIALALLPFSGAQAGISPTYRLTGHTPCGKPIYSYFEVRGYDNCGRPVGHWVESYPGSCRCRSRQPHCEPGHHHSSYRSNSAWSFSLRF